MNLRQMMKKYYEEGLTRELAAARVCQDIILKAIADGSLSRNVTVKGGVVMRSLTKNNRRATRDIDLDFIHYSIEDEVIKNFDDEMMRENSMKDIVRRVEFSFQDTAYLKRISTSRQRWIDVDIENITKEIVEFLKGLMMRR